ncbi:MAG: MOSC domain-containing protein [Rhodobacteraceae bacterium]|nr:MOSC domain-containing protein [Paracoccaceae bacterium]PHR61754.1 MAG: molybdenum cofactor biosysynthesis protein [Robiginitomaculum sp.]
MKLAALWRHPIKSCGREALQAAALRAGEALPWDRHWAVLHDVSKHDASMPGWAKCQNFMRGASTPGLAGIWATLDETRAQLTLRHVDLGTHVFAPNDPAQAAAFFDWIAPLCPAGRAQPKAIATAPGRGMTDSSVAGISLMNMASHRAVERQIGHALSPARWRGNLWLEGAQAWAEHDWIGREIKIGGAVLQIRKRIERCMQTHANPDTGKRDADILGALDHFGHRDFGMQAIVLQSGTITLEDEAILL